jgi:hypothetical protein
MFKLLIFLLIAGALAYCGATVKLGKRTFFGHVQAIWKTDEVQDLKNGVKETAGPTVDKVTRGVKKGIEEARKPEGSGSGSGSAAQPVTP